MFDASASTLFIVFVCIILSMSFHEAMHAFTGHWLGDSTASDEGRLTLNPLKHIDLFTTVLLPLMLILLHVPPFFAAKPVPFNPYRVRWGEFGAALIGIAGPLTNLVLAAITALIIRLWDISPLTTTFEVLYLFVVVNIGFFVFNMIPFPPLDGSRLLYAFAPEFLQRGMRQIEGMGFTSIVLFMFLLYPVISPIVQFVSKRLLTLLLI